MRGHFRMSLIDPIPEAERALRQSKAVNSKQATAYFLI